MNDDPGRKFLTLYKVAIILTINLLAKILNYDLGKYADKT